MDRFTFPIERLTPPVCDDDLHALARLLADTVESGEAVSFVSPLTIDAAEAWWRGTFSSCHPGAIFLVARDGSNIVGTAQLHPAWAPNQPHRAEVMKLLVRRDNRRTGLGTRLMNEIEFAAREAGFDLLTLDAKEGGAAERLYRRTGWTYVGTIPRFALDPDRKSMHAAVIFYKALDQSGESPDPATHSGGAVIEPER